ncbi:hypothetical protein BJX70DRAFT_238795 [Aspergillus crustosus]
MDVPVLPDPPEPAPTDTLPLAKALRSKTIPADLETAGSSGRSNGRSSIDSNSEKQWSQAGDADSTKTGSSGLSKLLASRRRRKKQKESLKLVDEHPTTLESESTPGLLPSFSPKSLERASTTSLVPSESNSPQDDTSNLLTDDSEPER